MTPTTTAVTNREQGSFNYAHFFWWRHSDAGMPAATMFSKFKSGTTAPQNPVDTNPIVQYFEVGKQTACAGPELVWKIHDAYKKSDGRVSMKLLFQSK